MVNFFDILSINISPRYPHITEDVVQNAKKTLSTLPLKMQIFIGNEIALNDRAPGPFLNTNVEADRYVKLVNCALDACEVIKIFQKQPNLMEEYSSVCHDVVKASNFIKNKLNLKVREEEYLQSGKTLEVIFWYYFGVTNQRDLEPIKDLHTTT